ncbi:MAG: alpha/beta hydrolase family protein [Anaerolineae bacterium]
MRLLEIILIVTAIATLLGYMVLRSREELIVLPVLGSLLAVVQIAAEGYRWQMLPIYAFFVIVLVVAVLPHTGPIRLPDGLRVPSLLGGWVFVVAGTLLAALLPVFSTPPTRVPVGTATFYWVDADRTEQYGPEPGGPREIMVQVWYPADPLPTAERHPWLDAPRETGAAMAEWVDLPAALTRQFSLVQTHSYTDPPLVRSDDPFPVVISVHGWGSVRTINQDQIEALAARGYVVFSADHTYGALLTAFPDGRMAANYEPAIPNAEEVGQAAFQDAINQLVRTYADDTRFMLDRIEELAAEDPRFGGRLDMERVGLFGHSTGGGAVIEACAVDPRCDAALGLDAWVIPVSESVVESGLAQPLMLINSEEWPSEANIERQRQILANSSEEAYLLTVEGTAHYDFTMIPLLSPITRQIGLSGPLATRRVVTINHAYLLAFFDSALRDQPSRLLAGPSGVYPEVIWSR